MIRQVSPENRHAVRVLLTLKAEGPREIPPDLYHDINKRFLSFMTDTERATLERVVTTLEAVKFPFTSEEVNP